MRRPIWVLGVAMKRERPLIRFVKILIRRLGRDDVASYAAALSYSFLFATVPLLLFTTAVLTLFHLPTLLRLFLGPIQQLLPGPVVSLLTAAFRGAASHRNPTLLSIGAVGFLWGMSGAFRQLTVAFNRACEVSYPLRRSTVSTYALSIVLAITVGSMLVGAVAAAVISQSFFNWLLTISLGWHPGRALVNAGRWIVLIIFFMVVTSILYSVVPDQPRRYRFLSPGSVVALVIWLILSLGFSVYTQHFSSYGEIYGLLGAVILLLLYLYLFGYALLFGMEINLSLEELRNKP